MTPETATALIDQFLGVHYTLTILQKADADAVAANVTRFQKTMGTDATMIAEAKARLADLEALAASMPDPSQLSQRCFVSSVHLEFLRRAIGA